MNITHLPGAGSRIVAERPNHTVVVTNGAGHGYVQRPFYHNNQAFVQRTYHVHGVSYTRVYHEYYYHGVYLHAYVPVRYYAPAFYGWAYSPWRGPVVYAWGWGASPWVAYYGPYFTPYPVYASASLWLTDYLLAASLSDAYQARQDAAMDPQADPGVTATAYAGQTALTPDAKQAIADEVQRQLAEEKNEAQLAAQNSTPDAAGTGLAQDLSGNGPHAYVVDSNMDVNTAAGQDCVISEGDVLQLNSAPAPNSAAAQVEVLASQGHDCSQGAVITVSLEALQEMQNHMRASIDQGLGDLAANPKGLPAPPASARGQVQAPFAGDVPAADPNAPTELSQAAQQANQTEQQVITQASTGATPSVSSPAPVTIGLGQTVDQVIASLGAPKRIANLGSKQIYVYNDMKITFVDGKVTDIE